MTSNREQYVTIMRTAKNMYLTLQNYQNKLEQKITNAVLTALRFDS